MQTIHTQDERFYTVAPRLLAWFDQYGRHELPWQYHHKATSDIYAVWLSEVMLQQTQVATVLGYFERFIRTFPTVQALAAADWDSIASLWAGLGYYARARNLHQGAKQVSKFIATHGTFPQTVEDWQTIKGVGRSTAGAIVAMGVRGRGVICDGNVKRVLTRYFAISDDINKSATDKHLWALADAITPQEHSGRFAQAMMDMGATLCTRTAPHCHRCPLSNHCLAYAQNTPTAYPVKSKKPTKPNRYAYALQLTYQQQTLWLKRESSNKNGIWEGLWCLPLLSSSQAPQTLQEFSCALSDVHSDQIADEHLFYLLGVNTLPPSTITISPPIKHTLTHFHWHLTKVLIELDDTQFDTINTSLTAINAQFVWCHHSNTLAIPKAMQKLLSLS